MVPSTSSCLTLPVTWLRRSVRSFIVMQVVWLHWFHEYFFSGWAVQNYIKIPDTKRAHSWVIAGVSGFVQSRYGMSHSNEWIQTFWLQIVFNKNWFFVVQSATLRLISSWSVDPGCYYHQSAMTEAAVILQTPNRVITPWTVSWTNY